MKYAVLVVVLASCALTSNAPPLEVRNFSPEIETAPPRSPPTTCGELALGRVEGSSLLRYRIVRRVSPVEVSPYETLRWTERPDVYVRRALEDHLFTRAGLIRSAERTGLVVDVEVIAFEQIDRPRPGGRVALRYELHDDRTVLASGVVTETRPASSAAMPAIVSAIGLALDAAASDLAARITPLVRARANCAQSP